MVPFLHLQPLSPTAMENQKPIQMLSLGSDKIDLYLGALVGTLSQDLVPLVSHSASSHKAWTILRSTYANPSRGHLKQIKDRLANLSKGSLTIAEYMQAIKQCTDRLASMGKPMDNEDIVDKILTGLDYEAYKPIIDAVNTRDTVISFEELHEKLITRENIWRYTEYILATIMLQIYVIVNV